MSIKFKFTILFLMASYSPFAILADDGDDTETYFCMLPYAKSNKDRITLSATDISCGGHIPRLGDDPYAVTRYVLSKDAVAKLAGCTSSPMLTVAPAVDVSFSNQGISCVDKTGVAIEILGGDKPLKVEGEPIMPMRSCVRNLKISSCDIGVKVTRRLGPNTNKLDQNWSRHHGLSNVQISNSNYGTVFYTSNGEVSESSFKDNGVGVEFRGNGNKIIKSKIRGSSVAGVRIFTFMGVPTRITQSLIERNSGWGVWLSDEAIYTRIVGSRIRKNTLGDIHDPNGVVEIADF